MMLNKKMLRKENRDWVKFELKTLTSFNQSWYARNKMCYEAKKNEKKLQHDEYEIISSEKNKNNESEKKIIELFN